MSGPYYQDEHVTLWHGDCLGLTGWLEADVLVTDPPYGIDYRSNSRRDTLARSIEGDKDTRVRDAALGFWRKANGEDAPALVFGTWRVKRPNRTRQVLVWDTKGALGMGAMDLPWKPAHQEVYVLGRGFAGPRTSDVLTYAPVQSMSRGGREHPHQKPIPLMRDLIAKCPPGAVADPFAGSGSTLVAAKMLGRRAVGAELDEAYCEVIAKRLSQDVLDLAGAMPDPLTVPVLRVIRTALIDRRLDNDRAISGRHTTEPAERETQLDAYIERSDPHPEPDRPIGFRREDT